MKKDNLQKKILRELESTPIVQIACTKVGISRQTFYRWMKEDSKFKTQATDAIEIGSSLVSDVAESNILNGIKKGDIGTSKFWLSNRHHAYRKPFMHRGAGVNVFERELIKEHYRMMNDLNPIKFDQSKEGKEKIKQKARAMLNRWKPFYPKKR